MSGAYGMIIRRRKLVGYVWYNGTSDVVHPPIWESCQEAFDHRTGSWADCICDSKKEFVRIYADYASGLLWFGHICPKCKVVVDGIAPYDEEKNIIYRARKYENYLYDSE